MGKRIGSFCFLIILLLMLIGYFMVNKQNSTKTEKINFSTWIVYWNAGDALKELNFLKNSLTAVSLFSAYYDSQNQLVIPENLEEAGPDVRKFCKDHQIKTYITIVNDKINKTGQAVLKDKQLLENILSDEKSRTGMIDGIVELAQKNGYDGIEIDYENIKKDIALWDKFLLFSEALYKRAKEEGLDMRVILEPSVPLDKLNLPEGPEYIMMAYNLHGPNDEPGPKASKVFVRELAETMDKMPAESIMAFATGGFDWVEGEKGAAVTEMQAQKLMLDYKVGAKRDRSSGCLSFKYTDQNEKQHTVWFADGEALKLWVSTAEEEGIRNFALWRVGGNQPETLEKLVQ